MSWLVLQLINALLLQVFEQYKTVLPNADIRRLKQEYSAFLVFAQREDRKKMAPVDRLHEWLTSEMALTFPNVTTLIMIALSMPVSSAEAERVFSAMNRIKTPPRSSMGDEVLQDLMFLSCNGPPPDKFPYEEAVWRWYNTKPRREKLSEGYLNSLNNRYKRRTQP